MFAFVSVPGLTAIIVVILAIVLLLIILRFIPIGLWISALAAGVKVGIFDLIGMRLRRVSPAKIVNPLIKAEKAGLATPVSKLEAHYLAGGNVDRVINALIAAERANIPGFVNLPGTFGSSVICLKRAKLGDGTGRSFRK